MRIGELAQLSGLTASQLRFYEAEGLIQAVRRKSNGYREYPSEVLSALEIIRSAQSAGFSLEQIRNLLPIEQGKWDHDGLLDALQRKLGEVEALQKHLKQSRAQLQVAISSIKSKPAGISCEDNMKKVMNRLLKRTNRARNAR